MSLQNKSILSINASKSLQHATYYNSVIHCAYYSCVQKMKFILKDKYGKTEEQINEERKVGGIHPYLINTINTEMSKNPDKSFSKNFRNNINSLKKLRVTADYKDEIMIVTDGSDAIYFAETVLRILNKYYGL